MRHLPALPLLLLALASPAMGQQERIPSHCIALAAGPERVIPAALTAPGAGEVLLRYLDHASFAILAEDGTLAVTDYTGWIGTADLVPDVVTMNNSHSTHWTDRPDPRIPNVLKGWPEGAAAADHRLDLGSMLIRNVPTDARGWGGEWVRENGNSIFIFEVAGLCIGHLGHLHQIPTAEQYAAIGRLDIVLVPVDGRVTLGLSDMAQVVDRLRSSVVIPMHWFSSSSLASFLDQLKTDFDVVEAEMSDMVFSIRNLPSRPTVMVLEPRWID